MLFSPQPRAATHHTAWAGHTLPGGRTWLPEEPRPSSQITLFSLGPSRRRRLPCSPLRSVLQCAGSGLPTQRAFWQQKLQLETEAWASFPEEFSMPAARGWLCQPASWLGGSPGAAGGKVAVNKATPSACSCTEQAGATQRWPYTAMALFAARIGCLKGGWVGEWGS